MKPPISQVFYPIFCHFLGMVHTHQINVPGNPATGVGFWNDVNSKAYYKGFLTGTDEEIDTFITNQITTLIPLPLTYKVFDPYSIMMYGIPALTNNSNYEFNTNYRLSVSDKTGLRTTYPPGLLQIEKFKNSKFRNNNNTIIVFIVFSILIIFILVIYKI